MYLMQKKQHWSAAERKGIYGLLCSKEILGIKKDYHREPVFSDPDKLSRDHLSYLPSL